LEATIEEHMFDQTMNYNLKFDVPAKYLGSEANALIANYLLLKLLSLKKIPVNAVVTWKFY
jgi:hypothetical protein